jgi:hypothetical protein
MDIKVFRAPTGQDNRYPKVERLKDDNQQKKKKDDDQKKKKNQKMEGIFSSLAENLAHDDEGY